MTKEEPAARSDYPKLLETRRVYTRDMGVTYALWEIEPQVLRAFGIAGSDVSAEAAMMAGKKLTERQARAQGFEWLMFNTYAK